ncbi:MAG: hypothetical protein JJU02_15640 [Cryomorphaceae bacterium]|nr:hypothetical protein [Cryomorphaceae bacterium]
MIAFHRTVLIVLVFAGATVFGQLKKGDFLVGLSLELPFPEDYPINTFQKPATITGILTYTNIQYVVSDHWAIGGRLGYTYENDMAGLFTKYASGKNTFSIGPSVKWFDTFSDWGYFSFEGFFEYGGGRRFGYENSTSDFLQRMLSQLIGQPYHVPSSSNYWNHWQVGIIPGVAIAVSDNLLVEIQYGYLGYYKGYKVVENENLSSNSTEDRMGFDFSMTTARFSIILVL